MLNEDNAGYLKYTGPQRIEKAMHSLEGIVRGIAIDDRVNTNELVALTNWIGDHSQYAAWHPFNEVLERLREILRDGVIDEEERADVLWLCEKFATENDYFCRVTSDMQRLQGILGGIVADGEITGDELRGLRKWMDENEHLRTCWPYDELDALVMSVLADGAIDTAEHAALQAFFNEFFVHTGHRAIKLPESGPQILVHGICAVSPTINFMDRTFCFTGRSERFSRRELAEQIQQLGGLFSPQLNSAVDYLIVGVDGNPCWAYACYGRKIEAAVGLRKKGLPLLIVHEYDYWDAFEDYV